MNFIVIWTFVHITVHDIYKKMETLYLLIIFLVYNFVLTDLKMVLK